METNTGQVGGGAPTTSVEGRQRGATHGGNESVDAHFAAKGAQKQGGQRGREAGAGGRLMAVSGLGAPRCMTPWHIYSCLGHLGRERPVYALGQTRKGVPALAEDALRPYFCFSPFVHFALFGSFATFDASS